MTFSSLSRSSLGRIKRKKEFFHKVEQFGTETQRVAAKTPGSIPGERARPPVGFISLAHQTVPKLDIW